MKELAKNTFYFLLTVLMLLAVQSLISYKGCSQTVTEAPPSVEGALSILENHLTENAPDTIFVFNKKSTRSVRAPGAMRIRLDSLKTLAYFTVIIAPGDMYADTSQLVLRSGATMRYKFYADSVSVSLQCLSVTKTQSRLRVYKMCEPIFPDSIAVIPLTRFKRAMQEASRQTSRELSFDKSTMMKNMKKGKSK